MPLVCIYIQCPGGDIRDVHERLIPPFPLIAIAISRLAKKEQSKHANHFVNSLLDNFAVILLKLTYSINVMTSTSIDDEISLFICLTNSGELSTE